MVCSYHFKHNIMDTTLDTNSWELLRTQTTLVIAGNSEYLHGMSEPLRHNLMNTTLDTNLWELLKIPTTLVISGNSEDLLGVLVPHLHI